MKSQDLKEKTTETLEADLKKLKAVSGMLIGILIVLFAVTIYGLLTKENNSSFIALIAVGISCSAMLPIQFKNIKDIKNELASRG